SSTSFRGVDAVRAVPRRPHAKAEVTRPPRYVGSPSASRSSFQPHLHGTPPRHMPYETILVDTSAEGVTTATLNRPDVLNSFNQTMEDEFAQLWSEVRSDDRIRAVVLAAAGDRAFSTGVDVSERLDSDSPFVDLAQPWAEHEDPGRNLSPRR